MAQGFVTHVIDSRRSFALLVAVYLIAFELVGGLAGMIFIQLWDPANTLLANPLGYFMRYGVPVGAIAGLLFVYLYRRHADAVSRVLAARPPSAIGDARFIRIAEEQCTALGIRRPRFGIIEVPQPNALAVGEGPHHGLIAVTRGLLDRLDDDELAAVVAHEASHIRNGDTRVLAANHALMRTAVHLQVNNPLRFEDWRQLIIPLLLPPFLLILLMSGFITMCSMKLAREARRGINLSRDFIADAEAVRVTHNPDALISALRKIDGYGAFANSESCQDLLFEGRTSGDSGSQPDAAERIAAITRLSGDMIGTDRMRRDTRAVPVLGFGRRGASSAAPAAALLTPPPPPARPKAEKPPRITNNELARLMFTDWKGYKAHVARCADYHEWRESDDRDIFGLRPEMRVPVIAVIAFLTVFHWPANNDWRHFAYKFSPSYWADVGLMVNSGPFCSGPSYRDGKCPQR